MKFYCTKYWATTGIIEFEGEVSQSTSDENVTYIHTPQGLGQKWHIFERLGKNVFETLE
jgi:hypothetical protein